MKPSEAAAQGRCPSCLGRGIVYRVVERAEGPCSFCGGSGVLEDVFARHTEFTCPKCGRTSHHPEDARQGYCGACHDWTSAPPVALHGFGAAQYQHEVYYACPSCRWYVVRPWPELDRQGLEITLELHMMEHMRGEI